MSREPGRETVAAPWSHPLQVAQLDREEGAEVHIEPDAATLAAIAAFLNLQSVDRLSLDVRLDAVSGGWSVEGVLKAAVVQTCVVTLEPVPDAIEAEVSRRFLRDLPAISPADDVELGADDLDAPEPLGAVIDLAHIAMETLALALDPWPRAAGAELEATQFAAPGVAPMTDEDARPFAGLRVLKGGRDDSGGGSGKGGPA